MYSRDVTQIHPHVLLQQLKQIVLMCELCRTQRSLPYAYHNVRESWEAIYLSHLSLIMQILKFHFLSVNDSVRVLIHIPLGDDVLF